MTPKDLERLLHRLDGRGYKAYRELLGERDFSDCRLHVDHVQADPFAAPSRLRVRMPLAEAALPEHVFADAHRQRAARDWLARRSGIDDRPLADAVPFTAPAALRVSLEAPHAGAGSDRRRAEAERALARPRPRRLATAALDPRSRRGKPRIRAGRRDALLYGETEADLRALEQIADAAQVRAIGRLLALAHEQAPAELEDPAAWFAERLGADWADLHPRPDGDLARPRLAEVMAVLNRLRSARFLPPSAGD